MLKITSLKLAELDYQIVFGGIIIKNNSVKLVSCL